MSVTKMFFCVAYRPLIQRHEEVENFCTSLDQLVSNRDIQHPACSILTMSLMRNVQNNALLLKVTH